MNNQAISTAIARLKTPVFLARKIETGARPIVALYTTERGRRRELARQAAAEMTREGLGADCRVVFTRQSKLRPRSLQALLKGLGQGEIVYDPTGLVTRSAAVVACAAYIRAQAVVPLKGIYLNAERRALFVIVDARAFPTGSEALLAKRVEAMTRVAGAVHAWRAAVGPDFDLAIRIGFELPAALPVIAVDTSSLSASRRWTRGGIAAALGSLLGFGALASAQAADLPRPPPAPTPIVVVPRQAPAVAAVNFDFLAAGIFLNGDGFDNKTVGAVGGKVAIPLGQQFGTQVDGAIGTDNYWGIGGHLFWRDPSVGLVGVIASHESFEGRTFDRYGGEAELYLQNVTLRGEISQQGGDAPHTLLGALDVTFYAHPNFSITGGAHRENAEWRGHVGLEWQPEGLAGLSLFADGDLGDNNFAKAVAGVSFHFGSRGVTLIDRDRKYDPQFGLFHFAPKPAGYSPPGP